MSIPEVDWKKISSFEQSGEPVMKQEPGAKTPGTFDFEDLDTYHQRIECLPCQQKKWRAFERQ
jgi:hypothetical protein